MNHSSSGVLVACFVEFPMFDAQFLFAVGELALVNLMWRSYLIKVVSERP